MRRFGRTVFEFFGLLLIGSAIGFSVNGVRENTIKPTQNYFDLKIDLDKGGGPAAKNPLNASDKTNTTGSGSDSPADVRKVHGFVAVNATEALALFNDSKKESGLYVFVDARNDERFAEGHIPGAVQCDHYLLTKYLDRTIERANGAGKVIVYCNGGDCEDSGLVCKDLYEAGISYDALLLFDEGWTEWSKRNYPKETGSATQDSEERSPVEGYYDSESSAADDSTDSPSTETDE